MASRDAEWECLAETTSAWHVRREWATRSMSRRGDRRRQAEGGFEPVGADLILRSPRSTWLLPQRNRRPRTTGAFTLKSSGASGLNKLSPALHYLGGVGFAEVNLQDDDSPQAKACRPWSGLIELKGKRVFLPSALAPNYVIM